MANSQVLCLESEEPYVKVTESNPEFYYSEGQRLALETLLVEGEEGFKKCLAQEKLRHFLSDVELQELKTAATAEDSRALQPGGAGICSHGDQGSSLSYWPGRSDEPTPDLELGWPNNGAWKGITRAEVYTHPPGEGAPHIKELVRRCIQQATKVIAIVMDIFTDPDILLDLYDAAVRRRVPVYIILTRQHLASFLSMAEKTCLNVRYTENLRVRLIRGCTFQSRHQKQVTGTAKEKFLLVDGEVVITGSYRDSPPVRPVSNHRLEAVSVAVTEGPFITGHFSGPCLTYPTWLRSLSRDSCHHWQNEIKSIEHENVVTSCLTHFGVLISEKKASWFQTERRQFSVKGQKLSSYKIPGFKSLIHSFTWTDARLNRHLVTRLTGEVTEAFDREFRTLYAASCSLPALGMPPRPQIAAVSPLPSANGPDAAPFISILDGVQLSNRIAERRSVAPQPVAKSRAGEWELVLASPATAEEPLLPAPPPEVSIKNRLAAWRGVDMAAGALQGGPDAHNALSDILRNVQRSRLSAAKTTGARASKSLWDLSRFSQLSGSSTGWGRNGTDAAEDAKKWGYQDTPAKELMKQRGAGHAPEEPRMPVYLPHGRMTPSPGYLPLGRLQGQLYHNPTSTGLPRAWGHSGKPHYGHQLRF